MVHEQWQFVEDLRGIINFEDGTIRSGIFFPQVDSDVGIERLFVQPMAPGTQELTRGPLSLIVVSSTEDNLLLLDINFIWALKSISVTP